MSRAEDTESDTLTQSSLLSPQSCIVVTEPSQVAEVRRVAGRLSRQLGFNELAEGKVALVATELATNLLKHAIGGQVLINSLTQNGSNSVELLALDKGPGMSDVAQCLHDGYSTGCSPGTGLGAILRIASLADVYSVPGVGTAVFARIQDKVSSSKFQVPSQNSIGSGFRTLSVGGVCLAKSGEEVSGDAWVVEQHHGRCVLMVADGLGHGPDAARAAGEAVRICHAHLTKAPGDILTATHGALRATRGAAVAVTEIDQTKSQVRFCGVGNIAGTLLSASGSRSMVSHNGIVGHEARKIQEFVYPWTADMLLVMHSDGIASRWSLNAYPGLAVRHPSLIAGVLYRDLSRGGRDDVTVIAAKESRV